MVSQIFWLMLMRELSKTALRCTRVHCLMSSRTSSAPRAGAAVLMSGRIGGAFKGRVRDEPGRISRSQTLHSRSIPKSPPEDPRGWRPQRAAPGGAVPFCVVLRLQKHFLHIEESKLPGIVLLQQVKLPPRTMVRGFLNGLRSNTMLSNQPKCATDQLFLIWEPPRETTPVMAMEIAMLFFYLPIIIFDAMLPSPKRKAGKPTAVE